MVISKKTIKFQGGTTFSRGGQTFFKGWGPIAYSYRWERSGSVVECLTRDRGAAGSSLTGVTVLWSLSKTHLS